MKIKKIIKVELEGKDYKKYLYYKTKMQKSSSYAEMKYYYEKAKAIANSSTKKIMKI